MVPSMWVYPRRSRVDQALERSLQYSLRELLQQATTLYFDPMNGFEEYAENCHLSLVCGTYVDRELDMGANFWDFLKEKQLSIGKTSFILRSIAHIEEELPILPGFSTTSEDADITLSPRTSSPSTLDNTDLLFGGNVS